MNLDDFSYEQEDRRYINPQVSLDEQNAFIDNLRSVQEKNNLEIAQDTRNLGTDVPSVLGGLTGSEGYFQSRYQTPQVNEMVSNLRTAAQAKALNDVISNEVAQAKEKYSNAYKSAQKRAAAKAKAALSNLTNPSEPASNKIEGTVSYGSNEDYGDDEKKKVGEVLPAYSPIVETPGSKIKESLEEANRIADELNKLDKIKNVVLPVITPGSFWPM